MPRKSIFVDTLGTIAVAVVLALSIRWLVVEPYVVDGYSMQNTLENHERVLVDKIGMHFEKLHYGEIVVFKPPLKDSTDFVKRVIATGGQKVSMKDGRVYIDNELMPQTFLVRHGVSTMDDYTMAAVKVPKGEIFVLGDHRDDSEDSRLFGPVNVSAVQGVVFWVLWPLRDFGPMHQW